MLQPVDNLTCEAEQRIKFQFRKKPNYLLQKLFADKEPQLLDIHEIINKELDSVFIYVFFADGIMVLVNCLSAKDQLGVNKDLTNSMK